MLDFLTWPTWRFALFLLVYFPFRSLVVAVLTDRFVLHSKFAQNRTVYRVNFIRDQFKKELQGAPQTILADVLILVAAQGLGLFRNNAPTFIHIFSATLFAFGWTELWYYGLHRALHSRALFFIHRQHHISRVIHPLTFLSFSWMERVLQGLGTILVFAAASRVFPFAFAGFVVYGVITIICDLIGHLNVEIFPKGFADSWAGKVFFSPSYHAMHHARFQGHYGLFTPWFDRAFGTYFKDYPEVFERAVAGEGILKLDFKGTRV